MISEIFNRISGFFPYFVESKKEKFVDSGSDSGDSGVGGDFTHLLTLATIISTISKAIAIEENNYSGLDEITKDIASYEYQSLSVEMNELLEFCSNQLNLDLTKQENGTFYTIFSLYNSENLGEYKYPAKELILLAIAANDQLAARYRNVLFAKENLSLLQVLVGGETYINNLTEELHENNDLLKELESRRIVLNKHNVVEFFTVVAFKIKDTDLLEKILTAENINEIKKTFNSKSNSIFDISQAASLAQNARFIEIILNSIEKCVNGKGENELLKNSFISFLDTAISQEHASIVKYLCEKCNKNDDQIQKIYKEALADDKIFKALIQQKIIEKAVNAVSNEKNARNAKAKEIYDLVLTTASSTGSVELITKILEKIESVSTDDDKKFLQHSLEIILESGAGRTISLIETIMSNLTDKSVKKIYNEVWNEKNLAKERNNTIIDTDQVSNGDEEMGKSNRRKKGQQVQSTSDKNSAALGQVEKADLELSQHNNPRSSDSTTPSSSVSSNESDSSFDKVESQTTGGNIEGNQSVTTTGEESPLTNSDGESETPTSSFSVISSAKSTSGDEGKDDDNTLVESQSPEGSDKSDKKEEHQIVVETGKVDGEVEGSSTGESDQAGNEKDIQEEVQDPTLVLPQPQKDSDTEEKVVEQVEAPIVDSTCEEQPLLNTGERTESNGQNQKSDDSLTSIGGDVQSPISCSTPVTTQQIGEHDDNNPKIDLSSSVDERSLIGDDQSQTPEQFKDNGNTDSENIKRSTELENSKDDQQKMPEKFTGNENTASENTKRSAASIVAISILAIAATALVAASIYFEVMLTAGAIAGACCLAAAVITYFYTQPSTSLENTMANKQDDLKVGNVDSR